MKLYGELARWWPLLSPPEEYAEEAASYVAAFDKLARRELREVLELGSGGGNNASFLKKRFVMTLTDISEDMLAVSRALNPDCEHVNGDMRTLRLGRTFDAVLIHDAIMYLTTQADLAAAIETAAAHLRPGGVALFVPDDTAESYRPFTQHGGNDDAGRSLRYLEWAAPLPAGATETDVTFVVVTKENGQTRTYLDEQRFGLFPRATWLRLIDRAGMDATTLPYEHSEFDPSIPREMFAGVKSAS
ncbi:MAG: class I SAM-dependent methyltransferase [Actinomycetota bacterium]